MRSATVFAAFAAAFAAAGAVAGAASAQTGTLDQHSPWQALPPPVQPAWFYIDVSSLPWQAQIRAGRDGQLEGIQIGVAGAQGATFFLRIRKGAAWSAEPVLFETLVESAGTEPRTVFIDMTDARITLAAGEVFVMETVGTDTGGIMYGSYVPPPRAPAYPEPLMVDGAPLGDGGWRQGFRTYMIDSPDCYADCDESGQLDFFDFLCFQNQFAAGDPYADCDDSGELDFFDFLCFQNEFAPGCS